MAADSLFSIAFTGVRGGLVVAVADDPGMHSSQNEQDTRNYGKFAKLPVIEPGDSVEGAEFMGAAFDLSEQFKVPVILRAVTRLSHSRSPLEVLDELKPIHSGHETVKYERDPSQQIPLPMNARRMHREVEQKLVDIAEWAETCGLNRLEPGSPKLGIVASGIAYQYAREVFPDATFLKLGLVYPLPRELFFKLNDMVERIVVVEELDPIFEHHIRLLGIKASGKDIFPLCGEFSIELVRDHAVAAGLIPAREPAVRSAAPVVINGLEAASGNGDGAGNGAGAVRSPPPRPSSRPRCRPGRRCSAPAARTGLSFTCCSACVPSSSATSAATRWEPPRP